MNNIELSLNKGCRESGYIYNKYSQNVFKNNNNNNIRALTNVSCTSINHLECLAPLTFIVSACQNYFHDNYWHVTILSLELGCDLDYLFNLNYGS